MYRQLLTVCFFLSLVVPIGVNAELELGSAQLDISKSRTQENVKSAGSTGSNAIVQPVAVPLPQRPAVVPLPQRLDHAENDKSIVFGANLFTGAFSREGGARFNPDYLVQMGDNISIRMWGAHSFDAIIPVDNKGNLFIPEFGPVKVLGMRNQDIQKSVESAVRTVYRNNVSVYASLAAAQPVRVYVGGNVNRPGLYDGTSLDSVLNFLDKAGGIDTERGSFLNIEIKRGTKIRTKVNLYDFLLNGVMPYAQLADGDVIFVPSRENTVTVSGLVENEKRFEFNNASIDINEIVSMAKPMASATHVRVIRNTGSTLNVEYFALNDTSTVNIENGDELQFTADKKQGTITVRIEGEHQGYKEYVLPYGAKFGQLMQGVQFLPSADVLNIQLYRTSVKERQRLMLKTALKNLEASVLTARSSTSEASSLRKEEAALMMEWVERAKEIEPNGQVMIAQSEARNDLLLENGDIINIPKQDGLILVSGEVNFPNTIAYEPTLTVNDYIDQSGGYTQGADTSKIVLAHRDGSYEQLTKDGWFSGNKKQSEISQGDQILVLPKVETKNVEVTRALSTIVYQIAIAARVVFSNNF